MSAARMLSPEEVAEELGVSRATAYRLLPKLRAFKVNAVWRVERVVLESWIRKQKDKATWHGSLGEDASGTLGSDSPAEEPSGSRRTARTARRRKNGLANSKGMPLIQPTQPRRKQTLLPPVPSSSAVDYDEGERTVRSTTTE
jgi:hypothetical protein